MDRNVKPEQTFGCWQVFGGIAVVAILAGWVAKATELGPYLLCGCTAMVAVALLRFVPNLLSRLLLTIGFGGFLGVAFVVIAGLFHSPSHDAIDVEDRTDWIPPVRELKPQELLSLAWSSRDRNADWPVASLMLELSDIAYDAPATARKRIRELGWESESINAGSMQGYVINAGGDSIITLRGTERHEYDILQDLRFLGVKTEQGSMHGGFAKGYNPMHNQVIELLDQYETKRVWLTGHSLGGGLAVVCAYRLVIDGKYPIAGLMTFGQPKVLRSDLANYLGPKLDGKYVFFVNDMDPVTRLISPYHHFGHMVRWNDSEIERSRMMLMSFESGSASEGQEAGYIDGMSDSEYEELLHRSEDAITPKFSEDGEPLMYGFLPDVLDHKLDSYRFMLDQLQHHSTRK